jgi:hypothetical protein
VCWINLNKPGTNRKSVDCDSAVFQSFIVLAGWWGRWPSFLTQIWCRHSLLIHFTLSTTKCYTKCIIHKQYEYAPSCKLCLGLTLSTVITCCPQGCVYIIDSSSTETHNFQISPQVEQMHVYYSTWTTLNCEKCCSSILDSLVLIP